LPQGLKLTSFLTVMARLKAGEFGGSIAVLKHCATQKHTYPEFP